MALAETAELAVRLSLDDRMTPALRKAQGGLRTLGSTAKTVGKGIAVGTGVVATAGIIALTGAIKSGIEALRQDKIVTAQTEAVIKSTGGAAGVSAKQVEDLADQLSTLNGVQDDVVQGAENVILRFTSIGKDVFPEVTQAALDIAAATGKDASTAALQLGRALDNPIKSMTALTRLGVVFTDQEAAQIKELVKHNKLRDAQKIILGKVEEKFKGVARAQADADPGRRLAVNMEKFQKALASGLLPVIEKIQTRLSEWLVKPSTIEAVKKIGDAIGGLFTDENLDTLASGLETAAKAVGTAISAFNQLPPEIKALAIGAFAINKVTGGAVTGAAEVFGKILGAGLQKIFAANVTVIGTNVTGVGTGGALPGAAGSAAGQATSKVGGLLETVSKVLIVGAVAEAAQQLSPTINDVGRDIHQQFLSFLPTLPQEEDLQWPFGSKNTPTILPEIFGGNGLLGGTAAAGQSAVGETRDRDKLNRGQSPVGETRDTDKLGKGIESALNKYTKRLGDLEDRLHRAKESGDNRRIDRLQQRVDRTSQRVDAAKQQLTSTTVQTRDAARHAGITTTSAEQAGTRAIVAAIFAARPDVSVFVSSSNVQAAISHGNRAGPRNGSSGGGGGGNTRNVPT